MEKKSQASGNNLRDTLSIYKTGLLFLLLTAALFWGCNPTNASQDPEKPVRKAAVAGSFYPGDKAKLEQYVDALLRQADPQEIKGTIRAIVVPHAGYVYSGPVAAYAYKAAAKQDIKTVILMCNSHRQWLDGIAVYTKGEFETPLGTVPVNSEKIAKLLETDSKIIEMPEAHEGDHVLEVQLPFLQRTFKNFTIVPLLFGNDSPELPRNLANALEKIMDEKTLLVASSDMSHYPSYEDANMADHETIDAILTGNPSKLTDTMTDLETKHIPQAETFLCGISGVMTAMLVSKAEGATDIQLLKYANSGDTAGDKRRVVGYSAIVFAIPASDPSPVATANDIKEAAAEEGELNAPEQNELLNLARATVESFIRTRKIPPYMPTSKKLERPAGAFVTLKEHGNLRGCIGRFEPNIPLYLVIQQMAVAAATQDPRFNPVKEGELDKLEYEISVLSPLKKVSSAEEIELGKHGVEVQKGFRSGVFLPQVATETGWSKEEFLSELCSQKAGLPRNCWQNGSTDLYVFTAQVFPEEQK